MLESGMGYCSGCHQVFTHGDLQKCEYTVGYLSYCPSCLGKERQRFQDICTGCQEPFVKSHKSDVRHLCGLCRSDDVLWNMALLNRQLARARDAGLPATLTSREWIITVNEFEGKCGYCGVKAYAVMEHYIPISKGGGTTAQNCVPSCDGCNNMKGDRDYHYDMSFERVRVYLATR